MLHRFIRRGNQQIIIPIYRPNRGICCINRVVSFYKTPISEKYEVFYLLIQKSSLPLQRFRSGQRLTERGVKYILQVFYEELFLLKNLVNFTAHRE